MASPIEGQKEAIWLFTASETLILGVAGSEGVCGGVKWNGFDHAPKERTKSVSFSDTASVSAFSEFSSRTEATRGNIPSETTLGSLVRKPEGGGGSVVAEAGGEAVVSVAEGGVVVSVAGEGMMVTLSRGAATVPAAAVVAVAAGAADSDFFTIESGIAGVTGFGLADHRPRYGHRGSRGKARCRSDSSPVTTQEVFGSVSTLTESSLFSSIEEKARIP
uniref:Uncharacterized protein n=1 Tax=Brassica oleracea var. oleracea TaxID=109376 RepID=A0A0D3BJJ7_BRAOL